MRTISISVLILLSIGVASCLSTPNGEAEGGGCESNGECISNICLEGSCAEEACSDVDPCDRAILGFECQGGECVLPCDDDAECFGFTCAGGRCVSESISSVSVDEDNLESLGPAAAGGPSDADPRDLPQLPDPDPDDYYGK